MRKTEWMLVFSSVLLMLLGGCMAPKFSIKEPPVLKEPNPALGRPAFQPVSPEVPVVSAEKSGMRKLPNWRRTKVAVLGFEGYSLDHLMLKLMQAGMMRIVDLGAAPYILVAANETGRRGSTWWASVLEKTARIGRGVAADYILIGAFTIKAGQTEKQVTQFYIPDSELIQYKDAKKVFVAKMHEYLDVLFETKKTYLEIYAIAQKRYEQEKEGMGWKKNFVLYEGPYNDATEKVEGFVKTVDANTGLAQANVESALDVQQLKAEVEAYTEVADVQVMVDPIVKTNTA